MPQALLPLIPDGATRINERISVVRDNGEWTCLIGIAPIFRHSEEDRRSFRMFTAQLICQGGSTTAHASHTEHLDFLTLAIQIGDRFIPVDLRFLAPGIALRHERLLPDQTHLSSVNYYSR